MTNRYGFAPHKNRLFVSAATLRNPSSLPSDQLHSLLSIIDSDGDTQERKTTAKVYELNCENEGMQSSTTYGWLNEDDVEQFESGNHGVFEVTPWATGWSATFDSDSNSQQD